MTLPAECKAEAVSGDLARLPFPLTFALRGAWASVQARFAVGADEG